MPPASLFQGLNAAASAAGIQLQKRERERASKNKRQKKKQQHSTEGAAPAGPDEQKKKDMFPLMQAAAMALANDRNWTGSAILHHFAQPLAEDHASAVRILKSGHQQVADLYRNYAKGGRQARCLEIWAVLANSQALAECGLLVRNSTRGHEEALEDDAEVLAQDTAACQVDSAAFHLVRQRCQAAVQCADTVQSWLLPQTLPTTGSAC